MSSKMKLSDLFIKLMVNSQFAMASEDDQLIKRLIENGNLNDNLRYINDTSMVNEYLRISFIKTTVLTLAELDIIEKDCDILNVDISNKLVSKAMDTFMELKHK